jgi:hypothetical protein
LIRVAGVEYAPLAERIAALKAGGADPKYIQAVIDGHDPNRREPDPVTIYPAFLDRLGEMDPDAEIEVAVILAEQPPLDLPRVDLDTDTGLPGFTMDAYIEKLAAIEERKRDNAVRQQPVADFIEDSGGRVTSRFWIINALHAVVPVWLAPEIAAPEEVKLVHEVGVMEPCAADFIEVRRSAQTELFRRFHGSGGILTTFEGQRSSGRSACGDIAVAVIDSEDFNPEHVAYRDTSASTPLRIYDEYFCTSSGCVAGLNPDATGFHGAMCAGIVAQDLMDGQDPNYTSDTNRNLRSGIAAEASVVPINITLESGTIEAIERAAEIGADVISSSMAARSDGDCPSEEEARGIDDISDAANAAVLDGGVF